jgi:cytochrome c nitrite reductase small subunit
MREARVLVALGVLIGALVGIGGYTFVYARGYSYVTNDPAACANCHIMRDHFAAWTRSSHRAVAVCNDCHTPPGLVARYATKAQNGFWHSFYFTTGTYPDPLRITARNEAVTEVACRTCHGELTASIEPMPASDRADRPVMPAHDPQTSCIRCHATVGHIE